MTARKRIMFWVWDGWPEWKPGWMCDSIAWAACKIWGHDPMAECSIPEHDHCTWCNKPMPNAAPRKASTP